jgi:hypothetical protein
MVSLSIPADVYSTMRMEMSLLVLRALMLLRFIRSEIESNVKFHFGDILLQSALVALFALQNPEKMFTSFLKSSTGLVCYQVNIDGTNLDI